MTKHWDKITEFVDSLGLAINQTGRYNCPSCGGVNTFVVTRHLDGIPFFCFRQGCDVKGHSKPNVTVHDIEAYLDTLNVPHDTFSQKFTLPEYVVMTMPVGFKPLDDYVGRYPWVLDHEDVRWDIKNHNIVWMIKDEKGALVDALGRAVAPRIGQPKNKRYGRSGVPFIAPGSSKFCVVVEDINSALRLSIVRDITAIALMGTHIPSSYVKHIKRYAPAYVALDADARTKELNAVNTLAPYLEASIVAMTGPDIKDMTLEQFETFCNKLYVEPRDVQASSRKDSDQNAGGGT